jgi:uncharacterized protein (TIGR01244 family)
MAQFRHVTDDLSVAPQITPADVAAAADLGFRTIINNRPDGEEPGQPTNAEIAAAAKAAGVAYFHVPIMGRPSPAQLATTRELWAEAPRPVLAFCRSGTRSITTWAMSQAGAVDGAELVRLGRQAGYDLSGVLGG